MPTSIKVTSPAGVCWEKPLTQGEYKELKKIGFDGRDLLGIFSAAAKPVRTNNWTNFSKDFFLPTVVTFVSVISFTIEEPATVGKVAILGLNLILLVAALGLDLMTFPIRLITCIPRAIYNAQAQPIPFHRYLIEQGVDQKFFEEGQVIVNLQREKLSREPTKQYINFFGYVHKEHSMEQHWKEFPVNLIDVPASYDSFWRGGRHSI